MYGAQELSGPLAFLLSGLSEGWGQVLEEVHEVLANLTLALAIFHLVGVALASWQHHENLVSTMITGHKRRDTP